MTLIAYEYTKKRNYENKRTEDFGKLLCTTFLEKKFSSSSLMHFLPTRSYCIPYRRYMANIITNLDVIFRVFHIMTYFYYILIFTFRYRFSSLIIVHLGLELSKVVCHIAFNLPNKVL